MIVMACAAVFACGANVSFGAARTAAEQKDLEQRQKIEREARELRERQAQEIRQRQEREQKEVRDRAEQRQKIEREQREARQRREEQAQRQEREQRERQEREAREREERQRYEEKRNEGEQRREKVVDNRQERQARRIEHGVKNGSLTAAELKQLEEQQQRIAATEERMKGDGKLTRPEFAQLRERLDLASRCIFAEKHDGDGKTIPVYRLGRNVTLKPEFANKLADASLNRADARAFMVDFRQMLQLKHALSAGELSAEQRATMQLRYNELLNKYFVVTA
jgi:hypothetical protein